MKLNKKWIAVLLLVVVAVCLTACGEKKEEVKTSETPVTALVGKWQQDFDDGSNPSTYIFKEDGKLTVYYYYNSTSRTDEYTYTVNGDELCFDGMTFTLKLEGDEMFLGDSITLKRVK